MVTCAHCGAPLDPAHRARPWTPEVPMFCSRDTCRSAEKYYRRRSRHQCVRCGRPSRLTRCPACRRAYRDDPLPVESSAAIEARFQAALAVIRAQRHVTGTIAWAVRGGIVAHPVRMPRYPGR